MEEATTIRKNKLNGNSKLSISSINKVIGDLNGYLNHLYKKRYIKDVPPQCEYLAGAENGYRKGEDVVEDYEYELIKNQFKKAIEVKEHQKSKVRFDLKENLDKEIIRLKETLSLYILCRHSGMRISEALGVGFGDFYPTPLEDENPNKIIRKHDLSTLSYIILESQLGEYDEDTERWKREPLKTKKSISLDNTRTIPIFSNQKECDELLRKMFFEARDFYNISNLEELRANKGQYLFFRNINRNIASHYLKQMYQELSGKLEKWKPFH
jgi:integrase